VPVTNTLAYYEYSQITDVKSFMKLGPYENNTLGPQCIIFVRNFRIFVIS